MQYVGFWRRFAALFIDAIILGVVSGIIGAILMSAMGSENSPAGLLGNLASFVLAFAYYVYYQSKVGQTLGKKAMGIKVVDAAGKTPSMTTFFLREIIGKFVSGIILGIGYLMVIWDPKKQALHDKIASTYVIKV